MRVYLAIQTFFQRVRTGEHKPGYPRFCGRGRYGSFCYRQSGRGFALNASSNRVVLSKIGHVKAVLHWPARGTIKMCSMLARRYSREQVADLLGGEAAVADVLASAVRALGATDVAEAIAIARERGLPASGA